MSKYLYGASVQGIQEFIFKTNKLKEIVGASEIVKEINSGFKERFQKSDSVEILLCAAGNIKAIFADKKGLEDFILEFAKKIEQKACGITLSQAVVSIDNQHTQEDIDKLEKRLKVQRNKPSIPLDMSINIIKLNPKTASASIKKDEDLATSQKLKAYKSIEQDERFRELHHLSNAKNKLAVIHIDGNGLGKLIPKLTMPLREFSAKLDSATIAAFEQAKEGKSVRKIILGGDDATLICNADDALAFTKEYLSVFENETQKSCDKLTACAGIAYSNEKYPFHYAVSLAEALCGEAKNHANRESSALMFHNIQSANYQEWDKFVRDELTIKNDSQTIRCDFGAYYLEKQEKANIADLINTVEAYRCDGSPISRLREWLSELYKSDKNAKNLLHRINTILQEKDNWNCEIMEKNLKFFDKNLSNDTLIIEKDGFLKTPIYDILQILSVTGEK